MCFKFKKDGTCSYFSFNYFQRKRTNTVELYYENDNLIPPQWKWINSDSLQIRHVKCSILKYNQDSIFLTVRQGTDTTILIKNCCVSYTPDSASVLYQKRLKEYFRKHPY